MILNAVLLHMNSECPVHFWGYYSSYSHVGILRVNDIALHWADKHIYDAKKKKMDEMLKLPTKKIEICGENTESTEFLCESDKTLT